MARKSTTPRCVECDKRLAKHEKPQPEMATVTSTAPFMGYGIHGNGLFCSHRCGFRWAVRWLGRIMWWR